MSRSTTSPYLKVYFPVIGIIHSYGQFRESVLRGISEEQFIEMALDKRERDRANKAMANYRFEMNWRTTIPHDWKDVATVSDFLKGCSVDRRIQRMLEMFWEERDAT